MEISQFLCFLVEVNAQHLLRLLGLLLRNALTFPLELGLDLLLNGFLGLGQGSLLYLKGRLAFTDLSREHIGTSRSGPRTVTPGSLSGWRR